KNLSRIGSFAVKHSLLVGSNKSSATESTWHWQIRDLSTEKPLRKYLPSRMYPLLSLSVMASATKCVGPTTANLGGRRPLRSPQNLRLRVCRKFWIIMRELRRKVLMNMTLMDKLQNQNTLDQGSDTS